MKIHIMMLLPLNIGKKIDDFHILFINHMVSKFSQDQKKGKNWPSNGYKMPKKIN